MQLYFSTWKHFFFHLYIGSVRECTISQRRGSAYTDLLWLTKKECHVSEADGDVWVLCCRLSECSLTDLPCSSASLGKQWKKQEVAVASSWPSWGREKTQLDKRKRKKTAAKLRCCSRVKLWCEGTLGEKSLHNFQIFILASCQTYYSYPWHESLALFCAGSRVVRDETK